MRFMQIDDAAELIRMEYHEVPGLQLTFWQAQHLCNLSSDLCDRALSALIASGFLVQTHDGRYAQRSIRSERSAAAAIASLLRAM